MKYAMKQNGDSKKNRYEAMKTAFRDMYKYYHEQDKPLITASIRQINEYFMNLECSQKITNPSPWQEIKNTAFLKGNMRHVQQTYLLQLWIEFQTKD